jgi:hypothetical protein
MCRIFVAAQEFTTIHWLPVNDPDIVCVPPSIRQMSG